METTSALYGNRVIRDSELIQIRLIRTALYKIHVKWISEINKLYINQTDLFGITYIKIAFSKHQVVMDTVIK
jgi:hypothetical protein